MGPGDVSARSLRRSATLTLNAGIFSGCVRPAKRRRFIKVAGRRKSQGGDAGGLAIATLRAPIADVARSAPIAHTIIEVQLASGPGSGSDRAAPRRLRGLSVSGRSPSFADPLLECSSTLTSSDAHGRLRLCGRLHIDELPRTPGERAPEVFQGAIPNQKAGWAANGIGPLHSAIAPIGVL
jgi:hypothetical protein